MVRWGRKSRWLLSVVVVVVAGVGVWGFSSGGEDRQAQELAFCRGVIPGNRAESPGECGEALREASRGRDGFRVVVRAYGRRTAGDPGRMPGELRGPLARAVAGQAREVHEALVGRAPGSAGARRDMRAFLRAVVVDQAAFRTVRRSQIAYASERIGSLSRGDLRGHGEDGDRATQVVSETGKAMGSLYRARGAAVEGEGLAEGEERAALIALYESSGFPRLEKMVSARAARVGISGRELREDRMQRVFTAGETGFRHGR